MAQALQRTAVLVIRVWCEEGCEEASLRARITRTLDVSVPEGSETSTASSEPEIERTVRTWIRRVTAGR
jgi:hypothetical protein